MTDEQKYLFDLQGFIVLKSVIPQAVVEACNVCVRSVREYATRRLSTAVVPRTLSERRKELYISNILEAVQCLQSTH